MNILAQSRLALIYAETARVLFALLIALGLVFVVILLISDDPGGAFKVLLTAPLSSKRTVGLWIDEAAKLTMAGLAFALVFQARQFSMGAQGQVLVGGFFAGVVALSPLGATWAGMPLAIIAAMITGAAYGFIPGYAKAKLGANEIVSSLMLNYIALNAVSYFVKALYAPRGELKSEQFPPTSAFPALIHNTRIDLGLIIAVLAVIAVWFALYRTSWGVKLRLVGHNSRFAAYAGIKANFIMVSAMTASGAIAGLLGAMIVQGRAFGNLAVAFEGYLSFEGILIAIVARNQPIAVPFVAFFYGYLRQGAALMGIRTDVPTEVVAVVQAIIILLAASSFSLPGRKLLGRLLLRQPNMDSTAAAEGQAK